MDLKVRGFFAFIHGLVLVQAATTTIRQNSISDSVISFNPNVPTGFIFDGSSRNNVSNAANSSDGNNALKAILTNTTSVTQTTLVFTTNTNRKSSVNLSTQRQSSTSKSTQRQSSTSVTQRQSSTFKSTQLVLQTSSKTPTANRSTSLVTPNVSTPKIVSQTLEILNTTYTRNASLTTPPDATHSRQTTSVSVESAIFTNNSLFTSTPTSSSVTKSNETTTESTTKNAIVLNSTESNQTVLSNVTDAVRLTPTTDPFNDNRPWNLRRSTHRPSGNGSGRRRTTIDPYYDNYDKGDTFWPVAMALTIGIPTIIVFAVTITVLYRRRMNKPRGLLGMYGTDYQSM